MENDMFDDSISKNGFSILNQINKELQQNNIININYLLLKMSTILSQDISISKDELTDVVITEVNKMLVKYSDTYKEICDNKDFSNIYLFVYNYMKIILRYYDQLMVTNQEKFDRYVEITNGNKPKKRIIINENLHMTIEDIQNTMHLLNEAVRNYYEIYYNKTLFATFTDEQIVQFKIKETELSHLLGVNLRNIANNPKYADLFHITQREIEYLNDTTYTLDPNGCAAIDVLHKIIDMSSGNLLQFEEDRLKKIQKNNYTTIDYGDDDITLSKYSKINMRSKSFINFKPLEELSLALNFPEGYQIIKQSKKENPQHSLLILKNNLSTQFKYSTLITNYDKTDNRRYFESLFVVKPDEYTQLQKDAFPSITTRVELASDNGSGGSIIKEFSVLEQIKFFEEIKEDFEQLDLQEIVDYFHTLVEDYKNSNKKL